MKRKNFHGNKKLRQEVALEAIEKLLQDPEHKPRRFKDIEPTKAQMSKYNVELKYEQKILKERITRVS